MRKLTLIASLMLTLISSEALAHAMLDHASPAVGGTVAKSPGQVTLTFTQQIEPKFSGGEVRSASGARVDQGASVSGNVMRLRLKGLAPGTYKVTWHVLSVDTHTTQGSFSFNVGG